MDLRTKIEDMLNKVGKNSCYGLRKRTTFWVVDKTPCIILDEPDKIQKRKAIQVEQVLKENKEADEIGFIAIDRCLIQESNCDFVVFKNKNIIFCEDKMSIQAKDKLEYNVRYGLGQIVNSKQYFNEKLLGLSKSEAFIGVPEAFTKNPNAYRSLQDKLTQEFKMSVKIGQKVMI